jgi:anti-sigma regulatory factor (Ser/Thr protein kinase)
LDQTLKDRGITVHRKLTSQSKVFMNLPAMQLAFENILKNSIEALDRMPEKEMTISLSENSDSYLFEFTDSGEGMDQKQLEKALDPFFTTRSFQNHVGLGLSLAAGVVREHGGQLRIESQKGQGTKVMIQLPKVNPIKQIDSESVLQAPVTPPTTQETLSSTEVSEQEAPPKKLYSDRPVGSSSVLDHLPEPDLDIFEDIPEVSQSAHLKAEASPEPPQMNTPESIEIDSPKALKKQKAARPIDAMEVKIRGPKPRSI